MRFSLFIIACLLISSTAFAQRNFVRNERVTASADKITISFDIIPNGSHENFEVTLRTSDPNIRPQNGLTGVSRAGQYIRAGTDKRITWYFQEDGYSPSDLQGLRIFVVAIDPVDMGGEIPGSNLSPTVNPPSVWAGLSASAATGLGLLTSGLVTLSNSGPGSEEYALYSTYTNPSVAGYDSVYNSLINELGITGRGDEGGGGEGSYYDYLNKRYKRSQWMIAAGGAILAASAIIIVNRIRLNRKFQNGTLNGSIEVSPDIRNYAFPGANSPGLQNNSYGLGIKLRF